MKISGAILDFDGTLLDSLHAWHKLDRDFLVNHDILTDKNLLAMKNSATIESAADYLRGEGFTMEREAIISEIRGMIAEAYCHTLQLFPESISFLQRLRNKGITLGLLTAAPKALVEAALTRLKIQSYFNVVICDVDKHFPEPFLQMTKELQTPVGNTIVMDDQTWVLELAASLGFITSTGINDQRLL